MTIGPVVTYSLCSRFVLLAPTSFYFFIDPKAHFDDLRKHNAFNWKQLSMMICFFNDPNQVAETLVLIGSRCVSNLLRKSVSGCFFCGEFHPWSIHATWQAGHVSVVEGFNEAKSRMFSNIFPLKTCRRSIFGDLEQFEISFSFFLSFYMSWASLYHYFF